MYKKKAVAIGYTQRAYPEILVKARGEMAERLLRLAGENDIPVYVDRDLTEAVSLLEQSIIPEDFYMVLAQVFAYCYNVNEKLKNKIREKGI